MTSTAQIVWKFMDEDVVVRRASEKGIVNLNSLARYLINEYKISASSDAVISAIRRYKEGRPLEKTFDRARKVLAKSEDIRITSNIVSIALEKTTQTQELMEKVFGLIRYDKGEILLINQGEQSIKLMINEKNKKKVLSVFPSKAVIHLEENVAEINIQLSSEAVKIPGIISVLSTELMMHAINLVEVMSCVPEMLFFIRQKDVVKAYEVLYSLCRS